MSCRPLLVAAAFFLPTAANAEVHGPPWHGNWTGSKPYIDELIAVSWRADKIKPAELVDDQEFLRRAYLDLTGQVPPAWEVALCALDHSPDKRPRLVDRLLASDAFARHWAGVWSDTLLGPRVSPTDRERFDTWLAKRIGAGVAHTKLVDELLTATGRPADNPATVFLLSALGQRLNERPGGDWGRFDAEPATWRTVRAFLGYRFNCIRCHDHPFTPDFKLPQFWRTNVLLRQLDRTADGSLIDNPALNAKGVIFAMRRNGVFMAIDGKRFFDGRAVDYSDQRGTRRAALARMVTTHANFSQAFVSRTWAHFFGRGFGLRPEGDDFGEHNPTVHDALLAKLAADTTAARHDVRVLIRWICSSRAYQRQPTYNDSNQAAEQEHYFSRMALKPLRPNVRMEAVLRAVRAEQTLTPAELADLRRRWRAALIPPSRDDELDEDVCHAPPLLGASFEFAQFLTNDRTLQKAILHPNGTVAQALGAPEPLAELYHAALGRAPRPEEAVWLIKKLEEAKQAGDSTVAWWQDVFYALLASSEAGCNR